jgi:hypothetical protein
VCISIEIFEPEAISRRVEAFKIHTESCVNYRRSKIKVSIPFPSYKINPYPTIRGQAVRQAETGLVVCGSQTCYTADLYTL